MSVSCQRQLSSVVTATTMTSTMWKKLRCGKKVKRDASPHPYQKLKPESSSACCPESKLPELFGPLVCNHGQHIIHSKAHQFLWPLPASPWERLDHYPGFHSVHPQNVPLLALKCWPEIANPTKHRRGSFPSMDSMKQVKPGFTNYQLQPTYSWALSEIEGKGKLGKTKDYFCLF